MDGIEELLRAWGDALVCRAEGIPRSSGRLHMLEKGRAFAPMTRDRAEKRLIGRDGYSRRLYMGAAAGLSGAVPKWTCDPVPCTSSRSGPARDRSAGLPDHLRRVNDAVRALGLCDDLAAQALRQQYTGRGTQADMAERLGVSRSRFEKALARGRVMVSRALHQPLTRGAEAG